MVRIKKILVPLDGSKNSFRGLDQAIDLARQCQATITGLYVVPLPPPRTDYQLKDMEKYFLKNAAKFMANAKKRSAQKGILFYDKIVYGYEGQKITKFAKDKKFDLIVIGSRGQSGLKELFFGSTSNFVLHKASMPVLIVK